MISDNVKGVRRHVRDGLRDRGAPSVSAVNVDCGRQHVAADLRNYDST